MRTSRNSAVEFFGSTIGSLRLGRKTRSSDLTTARSRIVEHVLLGERDYVDLIEQLELAQYFKRYIKLPLAPIDDPKVGIFLLGGRTLETPAQHFVHAGEVVLSPDGADAVAAIEVFARLALVEGRL